MSSDLIIDVTPSEIVIALQENKKLVELSRERSGAKFAVGDIYLAKVKKIMPSLNAAFIDVGYSKDAFLHYLDMGPQFATLNKFLRIASSRKNKVSSISRIKSEPDINKENIGSGSKRAYLNKRTTTYFGNFDSRPKPGFNAV